MSRLNLAQRPALRSTRIGAAVVVVGALLVAVIGFAGVKTLAHSKAGRRAVKLPDAHYLPPTPAALLAIKAESGAVTSIVVPAGNSTGSTSQ